MSVIPFGPACIRLARRPTCRRPSSASSYLRVFRTFTPHRTYATHKGAATASTTPLLSQALDQKARSARRDDSVGPFRLGLIPPTPQDVGNIKKWSELNTTEKGMCPALLLRFYDLTVLSLPSCKDNSPHVQPHRHLVWRRSFRSVGLCSDL